MEAPGRRLQLHLDRIDLPNGTGVRGGIYSGAEANGRLRARAGRAYEVAKGGAHAGAHVCAEHWATGRLVLDGDAVTPGQAERVARVTCGPTRRSSGLVGAVHPIDDDGALETEAEFRRGRSRPPTLACRRRRNALI